MFTTKPDTSPEGNPVDSRDVKLHYLYTKYLRTNLPEDAMELEHELTHRSHIEHRFNTLITRAN